MSDKERLDLDAVNHDLLKDVEEAGKLVQQRKDQDKADQQKAADRTIMYTIIVFAAVVIFALAYWKTFMAGSASQDQPTTIQQPVHSRPAPVQRQPMPTNRIYRTNPQPYAPRPNMPTYHPPRVITPARPSQPAGQVPSGPPEGEDQGM